MQAALSRHIRLVHKNNVQVKEAAAQQKKERNNTFNQFKKDGIFHRNQIEMKKDNPEYMRERRPKDVCGLTKDTDNLPVVCGLCKGFYARKLFIRHKEICSGKKPTECAVALPLSLFGQQEVDKEFEKEILARFQNDDIGNLCRTDPVIRLVGKRLWQKNEKKPDKRNEVRKSVMLDMRRLATLYTHFNNQPGAANKNEGTAADMFQRIHFPALEDAIRTYTNTGEHLKAGLKIAMAYLLRTTCKILKGTYLSERADDKASEIDKYLEILNLNHNFLFGDAIYSINKNRQTNLRKPQRIPNEEDVQQLRDYTVRTIKAILTKSQQSYNPHEFKQLVDLVVCRLTFFNGRRGGEPSRLLLEEWKDAEDGSWIDPKQIERIDDPFDKALVGQFMVTYMAGKGNNHLVPVLIPADTKDAVSKLAEDDLRKAAGINSTNPYLFPFTQNSVTHVVGSQCVKNVCCAAGLGDHELLTATGMRHRVSTLYALLDIPEQERQLFYKHMGHSAEINSSIYQSPLALMEVTKVGKQLQAMDLGKYPLTGILSFHILC